MRPQLVTALRVKNGEIKDIAGLTTWSGTVDIGVGQGIFGNDCIWLYKTNTGSSETHMPDKYLVSDRSDIWAFGQSDFTLSFYFKISTNEDFPTPEYILSNKMPFFNMFTGANKMWYIIYWYTRSWFDFALGHDRTWDYDQNIDVTVSHEDMANSQWHHIGWTRKSNMMYIFLDGEKKISKDIGEYDQYSSIQDKISIGCYENSGAHSNTLLDDFTLIKDYCMWEDSFTLPNKYISSYLVNNVYYNLKVGD